MNEAEPYSFDKHGDLGNYLLECRQNTFITNVFKGFEHFREIEDLGILIPGVSCVRAGADFTPDSNYRVNLDHLLESEGHGEYNMSAMGADKGVYNPHDVLEGKLWSIDCLDYKKLREISKDQVK